jgi:CheY-like chemotaxis protein
MKTRGPIVVIEDDLDDQELLEETFKVLNYPNKVIFFTDGYKALEYIQKTDIEPFIIISDINMPTIDGFELRKKIQNNEDLKMKCIPYLFFTTGANREAVYDAYAMSAQGFFIKPNSMAALQDIIRKIVDYWTECYSPSQYGQTKQEYSN